MSKEIFKKVVANDPKALAEIKLAVLNGLDIKYEIDEAKAIKVDGKELDWNKLRTNYKNKDFKYKGTIEDLKDGAVIMFDKNFIIYPDIKNDKYYIINLASESLVDMVQGSRADKDLKVYIDKYK